MAREFFRIDLQNKKSNIENLFEWLRTEERNAPSTKQALRTAANSEEPCFLEIQETKITGFGVKTQFGGAGLR
jgi:hypothetical protein